MVVMLQKMHFFFSKNIREGLAYPELIAWVQYLQAETEAESSKTDAIDSRKLIWPSPVKSDDLRGIFKVQ